MNMRSRDIPELTLERLVAGELPEERASAIQEQMKGDPRLKARFDRILASNQETLQNLPPAQVSQEIALRLRQSDGDRALKGVPKSKILAPIAGLAVLASAFLFIVPSFQSPSGSSPEVLEVTRVKGLLPSLMIHRRTDQNAERLKSGDRAAPGDILQVSYHSAGQPFGLILSIDGRGVVTLHHPANSERPPVLTTSGSVSLPRSYELDDAPNYERFFLVTAQEPFEVETVVNAAEAIASSSEKALNAKLLLPEHIEQVDFTVRKLP